MRIYNGTTRQMDLPLAGSQRISIAPKTVSGDILANSDLLSLLVTSYTTDEVALIISGPFELKVASTMPTVVNYVVQSLEEAILRFTPPVDIEEKEEVKEENPEPEPETEEPKEESESLNVEPEPETEERPETEEPKKSKKKKAKKEAEE